MPYQCFQEALEILRQDREEKLKLIEVERGRIARLRAKETSSAEEERRKMNRVTSMTDQLENLKILADINDPMIKKRFEDGEGRN